MRILCSLIALATLALLVSERHVVACVIAANAAYESVGHGAYAASDVSAEARTKFLVDAATARERVTELLGLLEAEPVLLLAASQEGAGWLGLGRGVPGGSKSLPWGTYLVISPDGANADVIAHELTHAELAARVGYVAYMLEIPTWFDEGLALQVDWRDEKIAAAIREGVSLPAVDALWSRRDFHAGDIALNYAASQVEVGRWLASDGHPGAGAFVTDLESGRDFDELYRAYSGVESRVGD